MTAEPLLLDPGQACARLAVGRSSLYQLVRSGRLRAVRPLSEAGELRFRLTDLVAFVEALEAIDPEATPATVAAERPPRGLAPARRPGAARREADRDVQRPRSASKEVRRAVGERPTTG